jgi:3-hydroxyacyl-CoA dehydrogenase
MLKNYIRRVAVLGAGVMGAQIAAQLTNANVETLLFDLPAKDGDLNGVVLAAIERLKKLKPAPFMQANKASQIKACNYEQDLAKLSGCDLIIEAIAERVDWKKDLYHKIAPYVDPDAIVVTNTSGLSIDLLADALPAQLRPQFCGVHFFNPPRYMKLVELIPHQTTQAHILPKLETFLVQTIGKGVIHAKDTPNFIANRIGVFGILAVLHHCAAFGLSLDEVDALTGPLIGRPKSATFRLADVVGLDTLAHVVTTMDKELTNDPWHHYYQLPEWFKGLIANGALGQKTNLGIYKKEGKEIQVFDIESQTYRISQASVDETVLAILKTKDPREKMLKLRDSDHKQAQFLWAIQRDLFHYSAYHLTSIAENVRDVDLAMRWGFGWQAGPFEIWQLADWTLVNDAIQLDIQQKRTMAQVAIPDWTLNLSKGPYQAEGAYAPTLQQFLPRSTLAIYDRIIFADKLLAEKQVLGETVYETNAIRAWTSGDGVLVVGCKTKGNTISDAVLDGLLETISIAENEYQALVFWQPDGANFSYGADLTGMQVAVSMQDYSAVAAMIEKFQKTSMRLRYSHIPTVAAVRGMVLGGGCELAMHCDKVIAAAETYMGLVEAGVGLLPAGGGTKEFARRAALMAQHGDLDKYLADAFNTIAMAKTSSSAVEAIELGYLRTLDLIVFNPDEILYVAKKQALALAEAGYRPSLASLFPVGGIASIANRKLALVNMRAGDFISEYDYFVGSQIAEVLCGGEVDAGSLVDEAWLLKRECEHFIALLKQPKTQERIAHTLKTGKPLRN